MIDHFVLGVAHLEEGVRFVADETVTIQTAFLMIHNASAIGTDTHHGLRIFHIRIRHMGQHMGDGICTGKHHFPILPGG